MAEDDMINKMEELQRAYEALKAEKVQAAAEAARVTEVARQAEEAVDSDFKFHDPINHGRSTYRGSLRTPLFGTPRESPNVFATEPVFNYTENLNLDRPNLPRPEENRTRTNTPISRGDESMDSECEYA